jgi:hypothetical protein
LRKDEAMNARQVLGAKKIAAITKALKEFGYPVTDADVETQACAALEGKPVDVGPGMMIRDMLKDEGWIR